MMVRGKRDQKYKTLAAKSKTEGGITVLIDGDCRLRCIPGTVEIIGFYDKNATADHFEQDLKNVRFIE